MRRLRTPQQVLLARVPPLLTKLAHSNGGIAPVPFTRGRVVVVSKPEYVGEVLSGSNSHQYRKGSWAEKQIAKALGSRGLFLTDDTVWWAQLRKIMNPAFKHSAMETVAQFTLAALERHMANWQDGQPVDLFEEFKQVSIEVLMRHLFGTAIGDTKIAELSRLADPVFEGMAWQVFMPKWLPGGWGYRRAIRRLEYRVYQLIERRRQSYLANPRQSAPDLLWHLLASEDPVISDEDLRHQVFTMLMAGFDSTASVLCEAARALAFDGGHKIDLLRAELYDVAGATPVAFGHLPLLTRLGAFTYSTLKDRPAFPNYFRMVVGQDCKLGDYRLAPGTQLIIGLHAMHHMPDTDRDRKDKLHPIPFGYGPRKCIGETMATVMMKLILGRMLQRYSKWKLADPRDWRTVYAMTERHFNTDMYLWA